MRHNMQIDELTLTHELKAAGDEWDAPPALKKILSRHGWESLGTGAEAAVAEHPQKAYVLKIFNSDSNYVNFVKFVQRHTANPHVPRFSRYVRQVPGTEFSYVRMEKLQPITHEALVNNYTNYLAEMVSLSSVVDMNLVNDELADGVKYKLEDIGYTTADLLDPEQQPAIYAKLGGEPPSSWTHIVSEMAEYSEHVDVGRWDMHEGNFMTRGSTLVIVDPFF